MGLLIAIAAGVIVLIVSSRDASHHSDKQIGVNSAAVGSQRFNREMRHCHLFPRAGGFAAAQRSLLLLGVHAATRLFHGTSRCEEARLAQATGVQALREDLSWAISEPHPNQYNWTNFDQVVEKATEAGLMVLPGLDDPPRWAAPTDSSVPANPAAYAAFVAAAVSRYGPGGSLWRAYPRLPARPLIWYELWNEPYYAGVNRDPGIYARLVKAAVTAGRAANPGARFLIEADTTYTTLSGERAAWLEGMYAAVPNLGNYFDALAVHPYGGNPADYTPQGSTDNQPGRVEQEHRELTAHGDGDKPIWVTEIGWSTCSGADLCVTEAQQAAYLHTFLSLALTTWRSYVRAVFVYGLRDSAPNPADDRAAWFGLLRPDLSRKPAWQVLHAAATRTK